MGTRPSAHPPFKVCGLIIMGGNVAVQFAQVSALVESPQSRLNNPRRRAYPPGTQGTLPSVRNRSSMLLTDVTHTLNQDVSVSIDWLPSLIVHPIVWGFNLRLFLRLGGTARTYIVLLLNLLDLSVPFMIRLLLDGWILFGAGQSGVPI